MPKQKRNVSIGSLVNCWLHTSTGLLVATLIDAGALYNVSAKMYMSAKYVLCI